MARWDVYSRRPHAEERKMKFGVYFSFRRLPGDSKPWAEVYDESFAQMRLAEDLGFDSVWLTEHHFSDDGYSPSVLPIAAAAAAHTSVIDIGGFHRPVAAVQPSEAGRGRGHCGRHLPRAAHSGAICGVCGLRVRCFGSGLRPAVPHRRRSAGDPLRVLERRPLLLHRGASLRVGRVGVPQAPHPAPSSHLLRRRLARRTPPPSLRGREHELVPGAGASVAVHRR